jgi:RHS repeat-associated protein
MDAFGVQRTTATGSLADASVGFAGQYLDTATGLYDMRARDYDPSSGRFTATDRVAIPTGMPYVAGYSYAFNNPLMFSDPTGLWGWSNVTKFVSDHKAEIVGAVAGVVVGLAVTAGCMALSVGVGTPGCLVLGGIAGGAVGSAVTYGMSTPAESQTALGWTVAITRGGAIGGITAGVGNIASPFISRASAAVFPRTSSAISTAVGDVGPGCASSSAGTGAANRAAFEAYKDGLRAAMARPSVTDDGLSRLLDTLYRPGATVGSGSTAAAVREELANPGLLVGGKSHIQKAEDSILALQSWLQRNPTAQSGDRAAAENVIRDMENALGGH